MSQDIVTILSLLLVFASCAYILSGSWNKPTKEGFYNYYGYYKKYCPTCGWRSRSTCSSCTNCGYCITASGYGECVLGDSQGAYHRDDCLYWDYGKDSFYDYPVDKIYSQVQAKSIYPYYRWNLRGPWRWQNKMNDRLVKYRRNLGRRAKCKTC